MLKVIASNTAAQLVAKFFGAGLTLLSTYYIIRLGGLPLYGDFTKIIVLVAVGFTLIDFGLNAEAIRRETPVMTVILTRLLLSCLIIVVLNLFIHLLGGGYSPAVKSIFWLGSLALLFQGLYTSANAHFQATLSYWRSTIAVVLGSLVGTALTFYFLVNSPTLFRLVLANTVGYAVMGFCSLYLLPRPQFEKLRIIDLRIILRLFRSSLPLGLILVSSVLASKIDTVVLGVYRSSIEVGAYGFAYRIFDVILVLPVFVMNALYPLLLVSRDKKLLRQTLASMTFLGLLAGLALYLFAPLVTLIRPELGSSIILLRTLALSTPLFYVTAPLMWQQIAAGRDRHVLVTYAASALFNLLANLAFTPLFGPLAAAWITGATELIILLSLLYFSRL